MPTPFHRMPSLRTSSRASACFLSCMTALAALTLVSGCALPKHPDVAAPPTDPYNPAATQLLDDTQWQLTGWTDASGQARAVPTAAQGAQPLTLDFSTESGRRRVSGFAGCNRFNGTYTLKDGKVAFGPPAATRMACASSAGALEQPYLDGLAHIAKSGVQMNPPQSLELTLEDGQTLTFGQRGK
ncbi:Heat shock protein [Candidatus Burkholderia verschuerenii]|uniref:Heat shock protein n=1 Tax=Candidatus Burkholderia verschuerenii TaxID=242163 RepID=A0A0L0MBP4_9BURK|nr:META domain-containing protein [Candidatus Burkholderia verschuerenii]KND59783.1 Heat shock protein [Candidatus Burkholderia verschuerenii]